MLQDLVPWLTSHSTTFYIVDWFNGESESAHPVFGKIIEGYDTVVKKIEKAEISETNSEQPAKPIQVKSVTIGTK